MVKPTPLRTESFSRLNCMFFDDLQTMMISLSSVILISEVFKFKSTPIIEEADENKLERIIELPFEGLVIDEAWAFKAYRPFMQMVQNHPSNQIEFIIYPSLGSTMGSIPKPHRVDQPVLLQQKIIGAGFSNFFEGNREKIVLKFGADTTAWPAEWNFGRVIRNAYSHGGEIHFTNSSAPAVTWRGLTYSPNDNNKSIHLDVYLPEIISLMKDMQKYL